MHDIARLCLASLIGLASACTLNGGPGDTIGSDEVWRRTFGGPATDEGWGVDVGPDGDVFTCTHEARPDLLPDVYAYRLSPDGRDVRWESHYAGAGESTEQVFIVVHDGNQRVYVAGTTYTDLTPESADALLLAFDASTGELLWDFTWDQGFGYEEIDGLVVETDGIYFSGWTTGDGTSNDALVGKVSLDGNLVWWNSYGTAGWDEANGHLVADEDFLYIAGRQNGDTILTGGDGLLAAFDKADGSPAWNVTWGEPGALEDALGLTTDGSRLYTVGIADNPLQLELRAFDFSGNEVWARKHGGASTNESSRAIRVDTTDGSLLIAGNVDSGAGTKDLLLVRADAATGEILEESTWGGPDDEEVHDLVLSGNRAYLQAQSRSFSDGAGWDALTVSIRHRPIAWPSGDP